MTMYYKHKGGNHIYEIKFKKINTFKIFIKVIKLFFKLMYYKDYVR